jgi:predicted nucleic-acid-binding Zn-ribbon protein
MPDEKIIMVIDRCPKCGCKDTVSRKAFEVAETEMPTGAYPALAVSVVPLDNPQLALVNFKAVVSYMDTCIKCGTNYCTKSTVEKVPKMQNPGMAMGGRR